MEPLTLLAWVGVIALAIIMVAIAVLIVWAVVQTLRGKTPRQQREAERRTQGGTTIIGGGR